MSNGPARASRIRTKLVLGIVLCLAAAGLAIIGLDYGAYVEQVGAIGEQSMVNARESFKSAEADDLRMLMSTMDALLDNSEVTDAFARRDFDRLVQVTTPMLQRMKERYGITNWLFIEPEPENTVFLRVHAPTLRGDVFDRPMYHQAVRTKTFASGKELGKAGFILRAVHPQYDKQGKLIGYLNLGVEIGSFLTRLRRQDGNEYALLARKEFLNEQNWISSCQLLGKENTWNALPHVVVVGATQSDPTFARYEGDLSEVPSQGMVLPGFDAGGRTYLRAVIPIVDEMQQKSGALMLAHDVTAVYARAKAAAYRQVIFILALMAVMSLVLTTLTNRLVFRRLDRVIAKTTRVVGGDYEKPISVEANDEVGKIEELLDQFRILYAYTIRKTLGQNSEISEPPERLPGT